jgi:phosphomannomutase/phosphoglucomutase
MIETGAAFGAEISGHYYFGALEGGSDSLYAACQMIAHLARNRVPLSELRCLCPPVYITPDLRVPAEPDRHRDVIGQVRSAWSEHPQSSVDGIRVSFPDGWALVRSSGTEPALTFRFEANDRARLRELVYRFCDPLGDLGDALWIEYEAAMGDQDDCRLGTADEQL